MKEAPRYFYSLDLLRGVASLAVILSHWRHFFFDQYGLSPQFQVERQPFYSILETLYLNGGTGVRLFFALSGFIFFWLYAERIREGRVEAGKFWILRATRLYPLHLLTLLGVSLGQMIFEIQNHYAFVYEHNDLRHFLLQLGLMSDWGFQAGHSFNGPIWSVSIEILLYAFFFMICRIGWIQGWQRGLVVLLGVVFSIRYEHVFWEGLSMFFIGGLAHAVFEKLVKKDFNRLWVYSAFSVLLIIWMIGLFVPEPNFLYHRYQMIFNGGLLLFGKDLIGIFLLKTIYGYGLLFFATILVLALLEREHPDAARPMAWLGDLSYATYLIHFPLQLAFILITTSLAFPASIYYSPSIWIFFFVTLLILSAISYHYFEYPMQEVLRKKWFKKDSGA